MRFKLILAALLLAMTGCADKGTKTVKPVANGVWQVTVGTPEKFNFTSAMEPQPKFEAISEMSDADSLPFDIAELKMEVYDGKTYIRFPLDEGEKLYGLGLNFKSVERRGSVMRLHVDHYAGDDNGRNHAPVPFFVSSKGYGAFINSARYIDVWAGTGVRSDDGTEVFDRNTDPRWAANPYSCNLEFLVPAEGAEIILFAGENMLDVVRRFNLWCGGGVIPPKWGLGFWQRTPTLYSDKDVLREVSQFREKDFPLTVIGLEPGWMSNAYPCTYQWDSTRFPNPSALMETLDSMHIKTNLWMNPGVCPGGKLDPQIASFCGTHTEWCGLLPDYSMPEARKIVSDFLKEEVVSKGASGFKMDENDGYDFWLYPDIAKFPSGVPAEQIRQTYGALMQKMATGIYKDMNTRTYGLVRASNAGAVSFPFVLYNDYYDHKGFITALINSSFIGTLWTPEVRSSRTSEEWLRRMQTVIFSPIAMLNAWADGTKPWSFDDVTDKVRECASLRMQLIPYLYTAFADYAFQGIPPVRAMNLEEAYKATPESSLEYAKAVSREVKDQFMVGRDIMVAPFFAGERSRKVVLPQGKWYDFWTGELVGGGEVITVDDATGTGNIPVYVRNGGIIPMYPAITTVTGEKLPVTIRHYGDASSTYELYDDNDLTYDYEKGDYIRIPIEVKVDADGTKHGSYTVPEGKQTYSISEIKF